MPFVSLVESSCRWAREKPDAMAYAFLRDGETVESSITYGELDRRARSLAAVLQRTLDPGSRALLLFPSGIDFIAAFVACLYAGVTAVPANNPKPKKPHWERLEAIVKDAGVTVILTTAENLTRSRDWLQGLETFARIPQIAVDAVAEAAESWRPLTAAPERLAFLQYTSGSTGTPKGVMVSHGNLMHNSALIREAFGHGEATVFVTWLPLFHDLGLIGNVLQTLYLGATCYLMTPIAFLQQPLVWLRAISRFRANTSMAPNFAYERCLAQIGDEERAALDLASWDLALNGAEPIRIDTVERFEHAFAPAGFRPASSFPAYGLAECTLITSTTDKAGLAKSVRVDVEAFRQGRIVRDGGQGAPSVRLVSSGRARHGLRLAIAEPETRARCDDGVIGEVWIHGESVCQGYWQRPEESEATFRARLADGGGPYLRTGDLGFLLAGDLYITGRLKELVIIRGQNFFPQDIEHALQQAHPALRADCGAAFAVDVEGEERLVIVQEVERTALRHLDGDDVARAVRRAVAEAFDLHVFGVVLIRPATLPKTSSGKIQRRLCKRQYEQAAVDGEVFRRVQPQESVVETSADELSARASASEVRAVIVARLARHLGLAADAIDGDTTMADHGLDSSVAVGFAGEIGRWVGREQDQSLLWIHPTVDALVAHVMRELAERAAVQSSAVA